MRQVKLAGTGTLRAPLEQKLPIGAELHHPGVFVAVAHVKRAVACDGNSSRAIEMTSIGPRHAALTEGQQQSSVRRELIDLLKCHVSQTLSWSSMVKPCGMANRSAPQRLSRIPLWPSKMSTVGRGIGVKSSTSDLGHVQSAR